ncbi:MAG: hypothetical protein COW32_01780 [Candidatus Aquicultor secundus]|uniref:Uncharacterized protein n=1 Tax=Candidatus Aquicultor secundus TaxID=1973895 RepID=A0A2M7T6A8_9ACTN|nr:hypothetical protein [Candidatus Aquicultor secundus]NCO66351.1 hypothetical protein [Solirubrobacter sp.]OIO88380.1 MAG: hypothetical protein AUK32_01765 [Candidatus Aquicultor secundus]PIU27448.1 MAG: hypothetical protein COT10_03460 [Candidatus Aquicultor secundus]PIW22990.1 MAG: hypothetical protein COW32_01780 [Candidatus Aquicultor secundus]PIX51879.1 MAG: hypothetical protein COZ51_07155 [Candidatus Aquicultor secundus]
MANGTINKITILVGFLISLISTSMALLTGGDIIFILLQRFLLAFAITAVLTWTMLTVVNSVIINAARKSMVEISKEFDKGAAAKGQNLDFTSPPLDDMDTALAGDSEKPEIKEFEPFKPRKIETDKGDSSQTN